MNQKQPAPPPAGLDLADIYYILFRRKWLICACFGMGLIAALAVYGLWPKKYYSEAQLYISYVLESKAPSQGGTDATIKEADAQGTTIINNELEILHSYDLALEVASNVGPKEILAKVGGGNDLNTAASLIQRSLTVEVPNHSSVMDITFAHPDASVLQPVLSQFIECYLKRHSEVHHPLAESEDYLTKQTDQMRIDLSSLDEQLREKMTNAQIITLEDSKADLAGQIAKIHQEINEATEDLAYHQAEADALEKLIAAKSPAVPATVSSNLAVTNASTLGNLAASKPATPEQIAEYHRLREVLDNLRKQEAELEIHFKGPNKQLKAVAGEIADTQASITNLETQAPDLASIKSAPLQFAGSPVTVVDPVAAMRANWETEDLKNKATQARIASLNERLAKVEQDAALLAGVEAPISDLLRKRANAEANFQHFSTSLQQAEFDQLIGPGKAPNIRPIEKPTPPFIHQSKVLKATAVVFCAFAGLGLGLAFALEMFINRTFRQPREIEGKLGVPFLLSIPWVNGNGKGHVLNGAKIGGLLSQGSAPPPPGLQPSVPNSPSADGAKRDFKLQAFYETLRDRMVSYFEALNLTHKPKLVAVTACHRDAGTTRIATGLATSLSETGEGRVLLVNMNGQDGSAHHFYNGQLVCGIGDALQKEKRADAHVQDNLYVAREFTASDKLSGGLPRRFSHLVPVMKASDYDYIIFDMPPVSHISITPKLAGFMDMVLLVIESEKTDREIAGRVLGLLSDAKANVGIVLNKKRSYVPSRLLPEL